MVKYKKNTAKKLQKLIDKKLSGEHKCWNCKYLTTDSNFEPKCTLEEKADETGFEWCSSWEPSERLEELQNSK